MSEKHFTEADVRFITTDLQRSISAIAGTIQMLRKDRVRMQQKRILKRLKEKIEQ